MWAGEQGWFFWYEHKSLSHKLYIPCISLCNSLRCCCPVQSSVHCKPLAPLCPCAASSSCRAVLRLSTQGTSCTSCAHSSVLPACSSGLLWMHINWDAAVSAPLLGSAAASWVLYIPHRLISCCVRQWWCFRSSNTLVRG